MRVSSVQLHSNVNSCVRCPPKLSKTCILECVHLLHALLAASRAHLDTVEQVGKSEPIVVDLAALELDSDRVLRYMREKTKWSLTRLLIVGKRIGSDGVRECVGNGHPAVVLSIAWVRNS